jgi:hypothetical protein
LYVSSADFYFSTVPKPLAVFIDGFPHTKSHQQAKDEVFRAAVRLAGYKTLELPYSGVSQRTLDKLYRAIIEELRKMGYSLPERLSIDEKKPLLSEMLTSGNP